MRPIQQALLVGLLLHGAVMCAEIVVDNVADKAGAARETVGISITGEIKRGDDLAFAKHVKGAKQIWLHLTSTGGDVDTAMNIGSELRKGEGLVATGECYSACVLVFAGAVTRLGALLVDDPVIGVHRAFFSELPPGLTASQVKSRYDSQLNRVRNYLAEMNVAPELLSFMQSIEPDQMRLLTREELNRYGLGRTDVVYEETVTANRASELGTTSLEYRRRKQRGHDECGADAVTSIELTDHDREQLARFHTTVETYKRVICSMAIEYGTSVGVFQRRSSQVDARCRRYADEMERSRCHTRFLVFGRVAP